MEVPFYRCKQLLEEILTSQGFTAEAENTSGLARSVKFTNGDIQVLWMYDLRDKLLLLKMDKKRKTVGSGYFYSVEQLQNEFLGKLEEMLHAQGFVIPEENRQLVLDDLSSLQTKTDRKGFLARLFGGKSS